MTYLRIVLAPPLKHTSLLVLFDKSKGKILCSSKYLNIQECKPDDVKTDFRTANIIKILDELQTKEENSALVNVMIDFYFNRLRYSNGHFQRYPRYIRCWVCFFKGLAIINESG